LKSDRNKRGQGGRGEIKKQTEHSTVLFKRKVGLTRAFTCVNAITVMMEGNQTVESVDTVILGDSRKYFCRVMLVRKIETDRERERERERDQENTTLRGQKEGGETDEAQQRGFTGLRRTNKAENKAGREKWGKEQQPRGDDNTQTTVAVECSSK